MPRFKIKDVSIDLPPGDPGGEAPLQAAALACSYKFCTRCTSPLTFRRPCGLMPTTCGIMDCSIITDPPPNPCCAWTFGCTDNTIPQTYATADISAVKAQLQEQLRAIEAQEAAMLPAAADELAQVEARLVEALEEVRAQRQRLASGGGPGAGTPEDKPRPPRRGGAK